MTEPKLRILMIAPTPYFADRGCHVRIYEEAKGLIELGHQVCIVTYHLGRDMLGVQTIRTLGIPWYKKLEAGPSWQKPFLDLFLLFTAFKTAHTFKPQIIHAHLHEGAFIGYFLKKIFQIPLIFDYQGSLTGESLSHGFFKEKSLQHRIFSALERYINNCADAIITSSGAGEEDLKTDWGISASKITKIIDGVDTTEFHPFSKSEIRKKLNIPDNAKVIVYLGLFNKYQGVDLLLDALAIVMKRGENIHALLMGFPEEFYKNRAKELGIYEKCTFTGRVPYQNAAEYLSAGDVAVSPKLSKTEANGKLFNYMACALPTVVFKNKTNLEILGDNAFYADETSAESFAEQIIKTITSKNLQEIGEKSLQYAIENHSWLHRSKLLTQLFCNILKKPIDRETTL